MKFIELLVSYLTATSGMKQEEVAALVKNTDGSINTEGVEVFAKADAAFKAKMQQVDKEAKDATEVAKTTAHNAGLRNGAEKVEKALRDRVKVEGDLSGEDLLKAVEGKVSVMAKGGELTKELVESSNFYITGVNNAKKAAEEAATKAAEDLKKYQDEVSHRDTMNEVLSQSDPIIESLKLNFSDDPERAKAQREVIAARIREHQYKTERGSDGKLAIVGVVDKDGKLTKDESGNPLSHRALVEKISLGLYDQRKGEDRKGDVKPPDDGKGASTTKWTKGLPKTEGEYLRLAGDQSIDVDARSDLMSQWEAAHTE